MTNREGAERRERLAAGVRRVRDDLLAERNAAGVWEGRLSSSALSTATAVMALEMLERAAPQRSEEIARLIRGGVDWLAGQQNDDGGWGDTDRSYSNISTTMLTEATLHTIDGHPVDPAIRSKAQAYLQRAGGTRAIKERYGKDHTFSVPILTHAALAGLVDWREIPSLPFELAVLPHSFFRVVQLPVVSYALPALIAIGQTLHQKKPGRRGPWWWTRKAAIPRTLRKLRDIQPESGGFLEATPLTSFVTMCLASSGRADHEVARAGRRFLIDSVRPDGSWPIDTNLATWVTTLGVNGLPDDALEGPAKKAVLDWLIGQQYQTRHPYTDAAPGGWAWTNLSGGVPDADDTPGAILAIIKLAGPQPHPAADDALRLGVEWLLQLQNRDGGWPTFCRGWGALPFDRSSNDLTAHAIRALTAWIQRVDGVPAESSRIDRAKRAVERGFAYLRRQQQPDGSWLPLWFGNQDLATEENPVYGTSKVLLAWQATGRADDPAAKRAAGWLASIQNDDGSWGGGKGIAGSVEETALAIDALAGSGHAERVTRGVDWLLTRVEDGRYREPSPIGFYFAKLWYYEQLYPMVFTMAALRRVRDESGAARSEQP